ECVSSRTGGILPRDFELLDVRFIDLLERGILRRIRAAEILAPGGEVAVGCGGQENGGEKEYCGLELLHGSPPTGKCTTYRANSLRGRHGVLLEFQNRASRRREIAHRSRLHPMGPLDDLRDSRGPSRRVLLVGRSRAG